MYCSSHITELNSYSQAHLSFKIEGYYVQKSGLFNDFFYSDFGSPLFVVNVFPSTVFSDTDAFVYFYQSGNSYFAPTQSRE